MINASKLAAAYSHKIQPILAAKKEWTNTHRHRTQLPGQQESGKKRNHYSPALDLNQDLARDKHECYQLHHQGRIACGIVDQEYQHNNS